MFKKKKIAFKVNLVYNLPLKGHVFCFLQATDYHFKAA